MPSGDARPLLGGGSRLGFFSWMPCARKQTYELQRGEKMWMHVMQNPKPLDLGGPRI